MEASHPALGTVDRYSRPTGLALVAVGVVHLLVPGRLLHGARFGYGRALNVRFRAKSGADRRVRLVGLGMLLAGAHLLYHGGVVPADRSA